MHKFKIGQSVRLAKASIDCAASGIYTIVAQLPDDRGDYQYRVRSASTSQERVVVESRLTGLFDL